MSCKKHFLSVLLAVTMIASLLSLFTLPASSYEDASSYEEVDAFSGNDTVPIQVAEATGTLGMHIRTNETVIAVSFSMPTWSQNGIGSMYLSAYKWEGNYLDTVSQDPLFTSKYERLIDNATNTLNLGSGLPAGEYLFLIENVTSTVGCWAVPDRDISCGECLANGYPNEYELIMTVRFKNKAPARPFGKITTEADMYGVAPEYKPVTDNLTDLSKYGLPSSSRYLTSRIQPSTWVLDGDSPDYSAVKQGKTVAVTFNAENGTIPLEKQIELLSSAGVDAIIIDYVGLNSLEALFESLSEIQKNGVKVPSVIVNLPDSLEARDKSNLYIRLYRAGKYNSLWYYFYGKPLIIGDFNSFNLTSALSRELLSFFSTRELGTDWFISSEYPQKIGYSTLTNKNSGIAEQICVNVSHGNGSTLQQQMSYALEVSPDIVIFSSWNENDGSLMPLYDGNGDSYYRELAEFARAYKGCEKPSEASGSTVIDIYKDPTQWADIQPYFASYICGGGGTVRNDIIGAQMAHDGQNIYILIECSNEISPSDGDLWMNIYLDTDSRNNGWNTFDYVINKTKPADSHTAYLEKFKDGSYSSVGKTQVEYSVDGRYLQVCVKKSYLKLDGDNFTLNFAVTDNVSDLGGDAAFSGDILNFYTSGDVAPGGRFKFSYTAVTDIMEESGDDTAGQSPEDTGHVEIPTRTSEPPTQTDESQTVSFETIEENGTGQPADSTGCNSCLCIGIAAVIPIALTFRRERRR